MIIKPLVVTDKCLVKGPFYLFLHVVHYNLFGILMWNSLSHNEKLLLGYHVWKRCFMGWVGMLRGFLLLLSPTSFLSFLHKLFFGGLILPEQVYCMLSLWEICCRESVHVLMCLEVIHVTIHLPPESYTNSSVVVCVGSLQTGNVLEGVLAVCPTLLWWSTLGLTRKVLEGVCFEIFRAAYNSSSPTQLSYGDACMCWSFGAEHCLCIHVMYMHVTINTDSLSMHSALLRGEPKQAPLSPYSGCYILVRLQCMI